MKRQVSPELVSVIVPTYNRAGLLIGALETIKAQTYRPIELIVVDDGSVDDTVEVLASWIREQQEEGFCVTLLQQDNLGAPAARNTGLRRARGAYIQWWDSDDFMYPDKLRTQVALLQENEAPWSCCLIRGGFDNAECIEKVCPSSGFVMGALSTQSVLYQAWAVETIGLWNEGLLIMQDSEYCFRALCHYPLGAWATAILGEINVTEGSIMRQSTLLKAERVRHAIDVIGGVAREHGQYSRELEHNFGRLLFYHYRQLARMGLPQRQDFRRAAARRCRGRSYALLLLFSLLDCFQLVAMIPRRCL